MHAAAASSAESAHGTAPDQARLEAVLTNVHAYYRQFLPVVDAAIQAGLAPVEKRLKVRPFRGAWARSV